MPPHRNFFVLCLGAARSRRTLWTMANLRIAVTAEEHVQRSHRGAAMQKYAGTRNRLSAHAYALRRQCGLDFGLTI
jgi:hypothetical protein